MPFKNQKIKDESEGIQTLTINYRLEKNKFLKHIKLSADLHPFIPFLILKKYLNKTTAVISDLNYGKIC